MDLSRSLPPAGQASVGFLRSLNYTVRQRMKAFVTAIFLVVASGCATHQQASENSLNRIPQFHQPHFQLGDLDQLPKLVSVVNPQFTDDRRYHECITGFIVNSEGTTTEAQFRKATDLRFAQACVEAVSHWRFEPARKDTLNVPCVMFVPFVLGEPPNPSGEEVVPLIP